MRNNPLVSVPFRGSCSEMTSVYPYYAAILDIRFRPLSGFVF